MLPVVSFAAAPRTCTGSVPVGTFQIKIAPADGAAPLPIRQVNTVAKGYRITCNPIRMPADLKKNGRIALVVAPTSGSADGVTVLDPHTLDAPSEWTMPFQSALVLVVFGPQGLDEKRVTRLVSKDDDLISELATYADQTETLEDTIDEIAAAEDAEDDPDTTPVRGTPTDQVLFALTKALNPVMAAYNPLGAGRRMGPATIKGQASAAFFENAGGFVPGGGALPVLKTFLMPDTEFRTVYTEPAADDSLTLCGQRKTAGNRNRYVYLWAHRVINSGPPNISVGDPTWLPTGARTLLAVKVKSNDEWPLIDRVRDWTISGDGGTAPVKVHWDQRRAIELDLRRVQAQPGTYKLSGKWDWGKAEVNAEFHLANLAEAAKITVTPESRHALVEATGSVPVRLEGADFQFVDRVSLRRQGRMGGTPEDLEFALPSTPGRRGTLGPQPSLEVEIDTNRFRAGAYQLLLAQTGTTTQNVPVQVLPPLPRIDNLPARVNTGAKELRFVLKGRGLDRIDGLTSDHATVRLGDPKPDEREVFITLDGSAKKGDKLALALVVAGVQDAGRIANAIEVLGPRPRIAEIKAAPPDEFGALLLKDELPAGSFVGLSIRAENLEQPAALRFECAEPAKTLEALRVRAGERRADAKLDVLGEGLLFASLDPGAVGTPGCTLQATVESGPGGTSEQAPVGRVVRLPRIDSLTLTNEKSDQGFAAVLKGWDLETIEKAGWDASGPIAVTAQPRSVAGEGNRQTLRLVVPWPSPTPLAPLLIWLRGDQQARSVARSK
jgi:hypothetical protein